MQTIGALTCTNEALTNKLFENPLMCQSGVGDIGVLDHIQSLRCGDNASRLSFRGRSFRSVTDSLLTLLLTFWRINFSSESSECEWSRGINSANKMRKTIYPHYYGKPESIQPSLFSSPPSAVTGINSNAVKFIRKYTRSTAFKILFFRHWPYYAKVTKIRKSRHRYFVLSLLQVSIVFENSMKVVHYFFCITFSYFKWSLCKMVSAENIKFRNWEL